LKKKSGQNLLDFSCFLQIFHKPDTLAERTLKGVTSSSKKAKNTASPFAIT
jgi:hypothetical protein